MTDLTLRAWAYLSRVVEPPCAELAALVARVGPIEAAERVRRGQSAMLAALLTPSTPQQVTPGHERCRNGGVSEHRRR
jgi:predicted Rossmann fold nucleotide-binding protein DprA/Smf involved in DNA uptake